MFVYPHYITLPQTFPSFLFSLSSFRGVGEGREGGRSIALAGFVDYCYAREEVFTTHSLSLPSVRGCFARLDWIGLDWMGWIDC